MLFWVHMFVIHNNVLITAHFVSVIKRSVKSYGTLVFCMLLFLLFLLVMLLLMVVVVVVLLMVVICFDADDAVDDDDAIICITRTFFSTTTKHFNLPARCHVRSEHH